jgi:N-acetylmuramoyl-L-alanine amidase
MATTHALSAHTRKRSGSGALTSLRAEGLIPGVVYGKDQPATNIRLNRKTLETVLHHSSSEHILVDLTRRETRAYSNVFARTLVGYWKDLGQLNKNPIRSAGFRVLKAHDVPSVLLELGYLSSERDLATLTTPQWREKAANVVARAVEGFFRSRNVGESARTTAEGDPFGALTAPRGTPDRDGSRP